MKALSFRYAGFSDPGPVRRNNQDAAYGDSRVLALADGIGGAPAGDVAASLMLRAFVSIPTKDESWDMVDHLRTAMFRGDDAIGAHVAANPQLDGMGTTLTSVMLDGDRLLLLHAGDSRAYLLREGRLYQLSHDDTFVQSLVDRGLLSRDEARVHPQRNLVLRAFTGRNARFGLANWEVKEGDRLLLCSDGVSDVLTHEALTKAIARKPLDECAEHLVALALQSGARDNVTCIVAEVVAERLESSPPVVVGALGDVS